MVGTLMCKAVQQGSVTMPRTCNRENCDGAVSIINDNGVVDPANGARWEEYECEYGHTFTITLA